MLALSLQFYETTPTNSCCSPKCWVRDIRHSGLYYSRESPRFCRQRFKVISPYKPGKTGSVRDKNNTFVFLIKVVLIGIDAVLSGTPHFDKTTYTYNTDQVLCWKKYKSAFSNPTQAYQNHKWGTTYEVIRLTKHTFLEPEKKYF